MPGREPHQPFSAATRDKANNFIDQHINCFDVHRGITTPSRSYDDARQTTPRPPLSVGRLTPENGSGHSPVIIDQHIAYKSPANGSGATKELLLACHPVDITPLIRSQIHEMVSQFWPVTTVKAKKLFPEFCALYDSVKTYNLPNFMGAQIEVASGLNINNWISSLTDYHDNELCFYLAYGFPLGYYQHKVPASTDSNHPSALAYPDHVRKFLQTECSFNALVGPFPESPFQPWTRLSPMMSRPKKDSDQRRIIVDLSFPAGEAVNSGIDITSYLGRDISYSLPSIRDLIAKLQTEGKGALIWKADLARAYRQLRADPLDAPLLGIHFDNQVYIDRCPPFGCRSSSAACQRVANALVYLMAKSSAFCLAYLDDFAGCAAESSQAYADYNKFRDLTSYLGLELSDHKCFEPTTSIEWLGYLIDTNVMSVSIPHYKLS